MMRAGHRLALLALLVTGCAAIRIEGQSLRPVDPANIEPIAVLIFQADTPAGYSRRCAPTFHLRVVTSA